MERTSDEKNLVASWEVHILCALGTPTLKHILLMLLVASRRDLLLFF